MFLELFVVFLPIGKFINSPYVNKSVYEYSTVHVPLYCTVHTYKWAEVFPFPHVGPKDRRNFKHCCIIDSRTQHTRLSLRHKMEDFCMIPHVLTDPACISRLAPLHLALKHILHSGPAQQLHPPSRPNSFLMPQPVRTFHAAKILSAVPPSWKSYARY